VVSCLSRGNRRCLILVAALGLLAAAVMAVSAAGQAHADTAPPPGTPATVSADALPTWQINGVVWSQVLVGNVVYATGSFTRARPPGTSPGSAQEVVRNNLLAYNITTGDLVTTFNHSLNAQGLVIMASPDGSRVYVGGDFTTVDGATHNHLAAFDTATGALVTSFNPSVSGQVRGIAATNSTVYVGGNFFNVNGSNRTRLAAVTASTGGNIAWTPTANDLVWTMVLAPDGSRVIAGGRFTTLNGVSAYGMGSLHATTGATLPWAANTTIQDAGANGAITSLRTDGTQIYGVGYAFGAGSSFEGVFAANPTTGEINWLTDCHGDTYDAFPIGQVVYNVSHQHDCSPIGAFPDTNPRVWHHALATTAYPTGTNTGPDTYGWNYNGIPAPSLLDWYPTFGIGSYTGQSQAGWSLAGNSNYVAIGGEFPTVNGTAQQGLVRFAVSQLAPNRMGPRPSSSLTPSAISLAPGSARIAWTQTWDYDNAKLHYDVLRDGGNTPVGGFDATSRFWTLQPTGFIDTGLAPGSTHTYRVRVTDPFGNVLTSATSAPVTISNATLSPYANDVINDSATYYWRLGEGSGTTAYDYAGFNDATVSGGVTRGASGAIIGDANTASSFNGSSGLAATRSITPPPSSFSIEAWVRTASTTGGKIVGYGNTNSGLSSQYDRHIYMDNDGHIWFGAYPGGVRTVHSAATYNDNQWHHIVATLSTSSGMSLYVDALRVGQDTGTTSGENYVGYWRIGGDNLNGWPSQPASNYLSGAIDDVAVYSSALSAATIVDHYVDSGRTSPIPPAPADSYGAAVYGDDPSFYWRLGETGGPTAADASAALSPGTYTGSGVTYSQPPAITGSSNTSVSLNGSSGGVYSQGTFDNPTVYSEELWFKSTTTSGGKLIGFGNTSTGLSSGYDRHVYMTNSGQIVFGVWTGFPNTITSPNSYNDGAWHHMVATQGGSGMRLYLDGASVGSNPQTSAQGYSGYWRAGGDNLGGWPDGPSSNYFAGSIDEVAVYPTVLSAATAASHYAAGSGAPPPNQAPTASFSSSCTFLSCAFDASASSDPDGSIVSYAWDFGDGTTGTGKMPSHSYPMAGDYTVQLTVTDDDGGTDSVSHTVSPASPPANQPPAAEFSSSCTALSCTFDASASSDPDGSIVSYAWDFGDQAMGAGKTPSHNYAAAGDYSVQLTVTDDDGATGSVTHVVSPTAAPTALATDTFSRTVSNGLGTADLGGAWTVSGGSTNFSVNGSAGRIVLPTAGAGPQAYLNSVSSTDSDTTLTVSPDKVGTGNGFYFAVVGRTISGAGSYRAKVRLLSNGGVGLSLYRTNSTGTETAILGETTVPGLAYSPGTVLRVRFQAVGTAPTTLRAKVWADGAGEPASWQAAATDTTSALQVAGGIGLWTYLSSSATNAPVTLTIDNLSSTRTGGGGPVPGALCGFAPAGTTSKVMVIWEENRDETSVVGNPAAPYLNNTVKPQCGLATNYSHLGHPSLPNYMSATSGTPYNFAPWTNDCSPGGACLSSADNIFRQQEVAGKSWRGYAEAMTSNCQQTNSGTYAVRHNPAAYYTNLANCGTWDVPLGTTASGALISDVNNGTLPAYSTVVPDLCNDGHDCSTATMDAWVAAWIPKITAGPDYQQGRLAIVIAWDESEGANPLIPAFVLSAHTAAGTTSGTAFDHYSLLRTTEEITGVPLLGNAATATSMRSAFNL
jgi:trimeric autotransporter adhesin